MLLTRLAAVLATSAVLTFGQTASAEPFRLDKSHAQVTFKVDHLGFSTVHGQFREFDANIFFSPEKVEESQVNFVINAESIDTSWPARDDHLRSKDFFNTEQYPQITFESTAVAPTGANEADITGNLTMVGQTHPITLRATLNNMGPSPFNPSQTVAGFTITGVIDRTVYGMNFAAPAVGTDVPIRIDLEMSPAS